MTYFGWMRRILNVKKIRDERLILRNLNNIRIAFIVQTIGIIAILGYDLVTKGMEGMTSNPLWIVFLITAVVLGYLSMNISVEHETGEKSPKRGLWISISVLIAITLGVGILVVLSDGFGLLDGVIFGGIIFVCGIVPIFYIYHLRKKQNEELEDE